MVILADYFAARVQYCAFKAPGAAAARACVAEMRVPPPLVQARDMEMVARVGQPLKGLVLDLMADDRDDEALFVIDAAPVFFSVMGILDQD